MCGNESYNVGDEERVVIIVMFVYKQQSEFVHDGNFVDIKDSTIVFLRSCVRNSLLKMLSLNYNKRTLIESLKQQIVALDYWQQDQ